MTTQKQTCTKENCTNERTQTYDKLCTKCLTKKYEKSLEGYQTNSEYTRYCQKQLTKLTL